MQESELLRWLARTTRRKRAFAIGSGFVLAALFVGIPAAVLAYVYVGFSQQLTSLLISALGALSTVLLVLVTFISFVENQLRMEKESQRTLVREELREVVQPSVSRLKANYSTLRGDTVRWYWFDIEQWRKSDLPGFELARLQGRPNTDTVVFDRFFGREPAIADQFDEHDERLEQLARQGRELVETLTEPLAAYIEANDIQYQHTPDDAPAPKWIASYVLSDVAELPDGNRDQEVWAEYEDEFRAVAYEGAPDELAEFRQLKREYLRCVESLQRDLERTRSRLQREYSISLNTQSANVSDDSNNDYSVV